VRAAGLRGAAGRCRRAAGAVGPPVRPMVAGATPSAADLPRRAVELVAAQFGTAAAAAEGCNVWPCGGSDELRGVLQHARFGVDPDRLVRYARHAEACGFEALYVPEHIALYPGATIGGGEIPPSLPIGDPLDPRQARLQVPPAGRPGWHSPGRRAVGGQHPRLDAAGGGGGRRATGQGPTLSAAQAPCQAPPGQGLRLSPLPAGTASAWDHAQDRPAGRRAKRPAWSPSVCGGTVAGLAGRLPAAAGPLPAARRGPAWVLLPGACADLPAVVAPVEGITARSERASTPCPAASAISLLAAMPSGRMP
jgi:hypothetical protein